MTSSICQDFPCLKDVVPIYYYKVVSKALDKISVMAIKGEVSASLPEGEQVHTISVSYSAGGVNYLVLSKAGRLYSYRQTKSTLDDFSLTLVDCPDLVVAIVEDDRYKGCSHIALSTKKELYRYNGELLVPVPAPFLLEKICLVGNGSFGITVSGDCYDTLNEGYGDDIGIPVIRVILVDYCPFYLTSQGRLFTESQKEIEIPDNLVIVDIAQQSNGNSFYCLSSEGKIYYVFPGQEWKLIGDESIIVGLSYNRVHTFMH